MEALQKPTGTGEPKSAPAAEAGYFLPPEGFAEGAINLGRFDLFDDKGRFLIEQYREVEWLLKTFHGEDIRQWVTPDARHIYVAVPIGAESRIKRLKRQDSVRQLGQIAAEE